MKPAARISDMHTCPMVTPGTPPIPHVGGPVLVGAPTVLIGFLPAARMGDMALCVGPPDTIAMGSPTVQIEMKMAARMGDPTAHGGVITLGCPTVLIGEVGMGGAVATGAPPTTGSAPGMGGGPSPSSGAAGGAPTSAAPPPPEEPVGADNGKCLSAAKKSGSPFVQPTKNMG